MILKHDIKTTPCHPRNCEGEVGRTGMGIQQQLSCPCSELGSLCHRSGCLSRGYFYSEFSSCHRRNLAGKPHGTFETSTQASSACGGGQVPVNQSTRRAVAGHLCALQTVRHKRTLTHVTLCNSESGEHKLWRRGGDFPWRLLVTRRSSSSPLPPPTSPF